jgi:hypothetical protein
MCLDIYITTLFQAHLNTEQTYLNHKNVSFFQHPSSKIGAFLIRKIIKKTGGPFRNLIFRNWAGLSMNPARI